VPIQKQLRGIGRFGYRVSKEYFLFLGLDSPSMSNPAARQQYFVARPESPQRVSAARKSRRYNRLGRKPRNFIAAHNKV
jgi:hypothetical protein